MSRIYLAVTAGSVHYKNALDGILELNGGGDASLSGRRESESVPGRDSGGGLKVA